VSEAEDISQHRINWALTIAGALIAQYVLGYLIGFSLGTINYSFAVSAYESLSFTLMNTLIGLLVMYIALDYKMFNSDDELVHRIWITVISAVFSIFILAIGVYHFLKQSLGRIR